MAAKANYTLIRDEWMALRDWMRHVDGDMEAKGMSAFLTEKGLIAPKAKGAKPGQDYLRYIGKKQKMMGASQDGKDWEAFLDCHIKETEAKLEVQERTGAPKLFLEQNGSKHLQPRAVREPKNLRHVKEEEEGWGSVTRALVDALQNALPHLPPELLEVGQQVLYRYAKQAEKRKVKKAGGEPL
jgi:hypothetical protein